MRKFEDRDKKMMFIDLQNLIPRFSKITGLEIAKVLRLCTGHQIRYWEHDLSALKRLIQSFSQVFSIILCLDKRHSSDTEHLLSVRKNSISGGIDRKETRNEIRNQKKRTKLVVCHTLRRTNVTPENVLIAIILRSIILYCSELLLSRFFDKFKSEVDETFLEKLEDYVHDIKSMANEMIMSRWIREVLQKIPTTRTGLNMLFKSVLRRLQQQEISTHLHGYYKALITFFKTWQRSHSFSAFPSATLRDELLLYFESENEDRLYQIWILYKILEALASKLDTQIYQLEHVHSVFVAQVGNLTIKHEPQYNTNWIHKRLNKTLYRRPDISVTYDSKRLLIEVKNRPFWKKDKSDQWKRNPGIMNQLLVYAHLLKAEGVEERGVLFVGSQPKDHSLKEIWENSTDFGGPYPKRIVCINLHPSQSPSTILEKLENTLGDIMVLDAEL